MFCSKCGKEIADEAVICPHCGCGTVNYYATNNHTAQTQQAPVANNSSTYSQDYIAIEEFSENVRSTYTLGIISLVLMFGIGLIFSIIVWVKAKSISIPNISTTNPNEIAMLESAKRKLKSALAFANAPLYVLMIVLAPAFLFAGLIGAAIAVFAVCLFIMFVIGIPCTKHLNSDLYPQK